MGNITVDGNDIQTVINLEGLRETYTQLTKGMGFHLRQRNFQHYDRLPSQVKHITIEEYMNEQLKPYREKIMERLQEELKLDTPNKSLIVAGFLLQGEYLGSNEIMGRVGDFMKENGRGDIKISKSLLSACIHRWSGEDIPIKSYLQKNVDSKYRLNPLLAKLPLVDVFELTKTKRIGKFSERDLKLKLPEIINQTPVTEPSVPKAVPMASTQELHVKVTFGPIRILFGLEK